MSFEFCRDERKSLSCQRLGNEEYIINTGGPFYWTTAMPRASEPPPGVLTSPSDEM